MSRNADVNDSDAAQPALRWKDLPDAICVHLFRFLGLRTKLAVLHSCRRLSTLVQPHLAHLPYLVALGPSGHAKLPRPLGERFSQMLDILRFGSIDLGFHSLSAEARRVGIRSVSDIQLFRSGSIPSFNFPSAFLFASHMPLFVVPVSLIPCLFKIIFQMPFVVVAYFISFCSFRSVICYSLLQAQSRCMQS